MTSIFIYKKSFDTVENESLLISDTKFDKHFRARPGAGPGRHEDPVDPRARLRPEDPRPRRPLHRPADAGRPGPPEGAGLRFWSNSGLGRILIFFRPRRNFTELNSNAISVTKIGQLPTQIGTKLAEGWQLFLKHYEKMIEVIDTIFEEKLPKKPEQVSLTLPKLNLPKLEKA